ncbi:MAG: NusG domain II-containing protein [Lachnospiraceae bacterium]|nr:NusG domain II-containing protein [Lachnospiraceae bacterium]MBQ3974326.1 NusG domain II-containing protein [Lachnospiraceae bacterium]MBQ4305049.1 NusG domain II-containing protein [Lachnospiraceae bacterium]
MFKIIRKADIVLFIVLLAFGFAMLFFTIRAASSPGDQVVINVDGTEYGRYPLDRDRVIEIQNGDRLNIVTIKDGGVSMSYSTCKNQICVHEGEVTAPGQLIVCLPNYVIVEIEGGEGSDEALDAIAQ